MSKKYLKKIMALGIIATCLIKIVKGSLDTDKIDAFLKSIDSSHLTTDEIDEAAKIC